ncbi:single-stranded DNA-binding protein [Pseudomonas luteola]|uniref:Single-stranded DNA-binding protein n=1 Tax=Pseudomonas luteola TaxID=47886 RepID=A0A2X2C5D8_PSELU|nr:MULTISPECIES: single-stranded DNA-binding protein [Pseudomonas]SPZ02534.1 single-stranded DNA-binding protein [Pseudomonas luteola]
MATDFSGEGNIGSQPEFLEFPNPGGEPRRLLRLNVYFDNLVPHGQGEFEDRGGFWANVEWWHRDAKQFASVFSKGMRVIVPGKIILDQWTDNQNEERSAFKIRADRIGILPHRIESVCLQPPKYTNVSENSSNTSPR